MTAKTRAAVIGQFLTRAVTPEQINQNRGDGQLLRAASVQTSAIDADARTVEVAFSSEAPVRRWFGDEVLSHDAGAMETVRLDNGAAVLMDHDADDQVGVVERAWLGNDRVGRALLRFGRSARAEEIWQDVLDGIRRHISVGYSIRDISIEERDGQPDLVTATRWEPQEISIVSIPADVTVGVGRSQGAGEAPEEEPAGAPDTRAQDNDSRQRDADMETRILRNEAGDLVRAKVDEDGNIVEVIEVLERASATQQLVQRGTQAEQTRVADLLELGESYSAQQLAAEAIRSGETVDAFTRRLLGHVHEQAGERGNRALSDVGREIGMSDREVQRFSFLRAIRALTNPNSRVDQEAAAFEFECSEAAQRATGMSSRGIMVPAEVVTRAVVPINTSVTGTDDGDTGGYAVATDLLASSFIDLLRNRSVAMRLGTTLGGLVGNVDIPRQVSGGTGYWLDEDDAVTASSLDLDQVSMSPKTVGGLTEFTRQMMMQSSLDIEALVRRDLATTLALEIDRTVLYGTGGVSGQPQGLSTLSGINAVDFATAAQPTYLELIDMETQISADNADVDGMVYVGNAGFRGHCKSTEKFTGTSGQTIWEQGGTVNGYRAEITNQAAAGDVFFGNWRDLIIGMWGALDLMIDPYTHSARGRTRVVAMQSVDFTHRHVESFCYGVHVP